MPRALKPRRYERIPKLLSADGGRLKCGAPTIWTDGPCQRNAAYPDLKCAYHSRWLEGSMVQRRRLDHGPAGAEARRRAWQKHQDAEEQDLKLPDPSSPRTG